MSSNASDDCSLDGIEDPNKSTFLADGEKNQHSSSFTPAFTPHSSVSYPVVNHLLTTVQSCSAEDSATSDYESTCSDSSFHFRHIIMSPRVLSPDSQTPSSGVVSQKDVAEFDYDDSSDASVDAYKSEPELAVNALATQGKLFRPRFPGTPSLTSTSLSSTAAVPAVKNKRAFVFDLTEKPASDVASESFRRWRKSTSDAANNFPALSRACDPGFSVSSQLPNFVLGANKSSSAFKFANLNSYPGAKERMDANKKGPLIVSKLCEQQDELGENSARSLGRSTSLPLSLHVATGMDGGSTSVMGGGVLSTGQTSPCASSSSTGAAGVSHSSAGTGAASGGAVSPFCGVFQQASLSPSSANEVRRSRCPSTSSRCSASSPRPPSRIDQIKIEEATGLERDTLFERDVTLSSSLASSWEDLCLSEHASSHPLVGVGMSNPLKRPSSSMSSSPGATPTPNPNTLSSSSQLHTPSSSSASSDSLSSKVTEPISISVAPSPQAYNPTIYPLACSPSPTRVSHANSKQCYSPLAMPVNWSSPSCPSPTQRKVFRRSQSPVHMVRPGILSSSCGSSFIGGSGSAGVKRRPPPDQLDSLEHTTPCKRPAPESTPPPPPPFFSTVPSQSTSGATLPNPHLHHHSQQQTHSHSVSAALSTNNNNNYVPNSNNNTNNQSVINTSSSQPALFNNMISISRNNSGSTSTNSSISSLTNEVPGTTTSSSVCSSPCSTPSSPPPFGSPIRCFTPSLLSPLIGERGVGEKERQQPFGIQLPRSLNMVSGNNGGSEVPRGSATPVVQSPLSEQAKVVNSETDLSQMEHN